MRRTSWAQRLAALLAGSLGVVLIGAAVVAAYVAGLLARIDTVDVFSLDPTPDTEPVTADDLRPTTTSVTGETVPELGDAGPAENFLIIGSDDISGIDPDDDSLVGREDEAEQSLADAIMLLRLDPANSSAELVSIPRDLWVTIQRPDAPFDFKINAAFNLDDPDERAERMVATVKGALDVPVHHYVHINWAGFRDLVDIIGGVELCFDLPQRDLQSGFLVESAGVHLLDADQALAFVRSRSMEQQTANGSWVFVDQAADLARIPRQQEFLRAVIDQTGDLRSFSDLGQGRELVEAAIDAVEIDDLLDIGSIVDLVQRYESVGGGDLTTYEFELFDIQEEFQGILHSAVQLVDNDHNAAVLDVFRGVPFGDLGPSRVALDVVGADAAPVVDGLRGLGFVPSSSTGVGSDEPTTIVRYGVGGEDAALLVAAAIDGRVRYETDPSMTGPTVVLELGSETLDVLDELRAPAEVPPVATTAAPVATSAPVATTAAPSTTAAPTPATTQAPSICPAG